MSTIIGVPDPVTGIIPPVRIGQELVLDPQEGGYRTREVWRGTRSQMVSMQNSFSAVGLRSTVIEDSGRPSLQVDIPSPAEAGEAEVPVEKWTFNKDYVQESLWANKKIMDLIEAYRQAMQTKYGLVYTFSDVLSHVRRDCENALKGLVLTNITDSLLTKGSPDWVTAISQAVESILPAGIVYGIYEKPNGVNTGPLTPAESGLAARTNSTPLNIYKLLLMGADSYEIERLVVTRTLSYSVQYWYGAGGIVFDETPKVYSTSGLIAAESIPSYVAFQFPQTPTSKPENTEWAWKVRKDSSEISSNGKVEETRDWVFAPWSTLLYTYVE